MLNIYGVLIGNTARDGDELVCVKLNARERSVLWKVTGHGICRIMTKD